MKSDLLHQLANHAGITYKHNLGVYQLYDSEMQTFADSIVEGAIAQITKAAADYHYQESVFTAGKKSGTFESIAAIREYFGVFEHGE
jgi:hypothetical protein